MLDVLSVTAEEVLYGYGPLGVGVVVLTAGFMKLLNILLTDRDKANAGRESMTEDMFTKVLPAITKSTEVLDARNQLDRELIAVMQDSNHLQREMIRALNDAGRPQDRTPFTRGRVG